MASVQMLSTITVILFLWQQALTTRPKDPHGGVKMGVSSAACDNAKVNLSMDGDPRDPGMEEIYRCQRQHYFPVKIIPSQIEIQEKTDLPLHNCMSEVITYPESPPLSGAHRPLWPVYGDYSYLPPQRWLHSLEHGAIVMLYHPCADPSEVLKLKSLVNTCLRRHIITSYPYLPQQQPFALLSWGVKLSMSYIKESEVVDFIKKHGIVDGLEKWVWQDGQFDVGLLSKAVVVSDMKDSKLCPYFQPGLWDEIPIDMML